MPTWPAQTAPSTGIDFGDGLKHRCDPACIQRQRSPMQRGTPEYRAPGIDILRNMPFPHNSVAMPCLEKRAHTTNPLHDVLQPVALSGPSSLEFPRGCPAGMGLVWSENTFLKPVSEHRLLPFQRPTASYSPAGVRAAYRGRSCSTLWGGHFECQI